MWNNDKDERYYKRLEADERRRKQAFDKINADLPRRLEIIKRIKSGEITLAQGQKFVRSGKPLSELFPNDAHSHDISWGQNDNGR